VLKQIENNAIIKDNSFLFNIKLFLYS
jgi:hypothetical protein